MKAFVTTCLLAAAMSGIAAPAAASTFDKRTHFTFSQPVTLPGITLPAGTYTFRLAEPYTERKVIQVADADGLRSYALLMTMPVTRYNRPLDSEIQFMETGEGMPAAVKSWFYVGDVIGYEFIYPKEQARRLMAGVMPQPEPAATAVTTEAAVTAEAGEAIAPAPVVADVSEDADRETVTIVERADAASAAEAAQQQPPPAPAPEPSAPAVTAETRDELPRTAGPVPLAALMGLATLLGGLWLNRKS